MNEDLVTLAVFDTEHEASLLKMLLADKGIIAALADNNLTNAHALISLAIGGVKVLVPKAHEKLARAVFEKAQAEKRCGSGIAASADKAPVEASCEDCGKTAKYPCALRGKVAKCPHCGAFIDVPD